ncbi:zinc ribbon domain-containing protein [Selenomonas ruminis]|uniref:Zinc ribbon domain-containing protein n=1 Tax=Selenomonas ruminis TaxID=2593411 RepID=A0A5D6WAC9_9FIRM|nr:zinc ribbon domain-containing protein [Selenomonas sp. mPRGC5]TYZ23939.1 zinc ribbon domain-containing protein [Selenomonas sp. mPRGC5]
MSKFCSECGTELHNDSVFCGNCGKKAPNMDALIHNNPTNTKKEIPTSNIISLSEIKEILLTPIELPRAKQIETYLLKQKNYNNNIEFTLLQLTLKMHKQLEDLKADIRNITNNNYYNNNHSPQNHTNSYVMSSTTGVAAGVASGIITSTVLNNGYTETSPPIIPTNNPKETSSPINSSAATENHQELISMSKSMLSSLIKEYQKKSNSKKYGLKNTQAQGGEDDIDTETNSENTHYDESTDDEDNDSSISDFLDNIFDRD